MLLILLGGWKLVTGMYWRHYLVMLQNVPIVDKLQPQRGVPVVAVSGTVEGKCAAFQMYIVEYSIVFMFHYLCFSLAHCQCLYCIVLPSST